LHKEQFSYHYSYYVPNYKGEKEKKKKKEDLTMAISGKAAQFSSRKRKLSQTGNQLVFALDFY